MKDKTKIINEMQWTFHREGLAPYQDYPVLFHVCFLTLESEIMNLYKRCDPLHLSTPLNSQKIPVSTGDVSNFAQQ